MQIAFDIGGTNTRIATITPDGIGPVRKEPTPSSLEETCSLLISMIRNQAERQSVAEIVGGIPGTVGPDGTMLVVPSSFVEGNGFPFAARLSEAFPGARVSVKNDASMAGLGEALYGAGKGFDIVVYVGLGTGVGTARIVSGTIDRYRYGFEAGNQILDAWKGIRLGDIADGKDLAKRYGLAPADLPREVYDEVTPILAAGLFNMLLHWSPDVLILGGSLMNEENGYRLEDVKDALARIPQRFPELPAVVKSELGDSAGLWGAKAELS